MKMWLVIILCLHAYSDIHRMYTCFDKAQVSSIAGITSVLCIHSTLSSPLQSSCEGVSQMYVNEKLDWSRFLQMYSVLQ